MRRFIEWDSIDVRVDGDKIAAMAREMIARDPILEKLDLRFMNGLLRVEGSVKKFISIPFTVEITRFETKGTTIRIPLARITAGPLPVPTLLVGLLRQRFPSDVRYEDPATLVMSLDRFLPTFVSADIQKIWIIDGGLAVTLGRGGADLPTGDTTHGSGPERQQPAERAQ
ncbi:MAG TPA: hypothetical protein VGQ76_11780 [Thermoanaerobaculia bacterium]|nr:hypothetical protein [Thermoanaerobaculia bacterium]